ncbi:unnamed protein product [Psylliodes chrysocephalus]|uniref:RanBP-type and C3HC4-type zinc finger-containing protein 1 n=1 Tax=Psylliodes chrysocephalus TaxID=3402493 RepID=A0A9P0GH63_9CUCU|nr:unnamed protein product [Psylliodes chrysocephala]
MSFKERPPDNTPQNIGCDPNTNSSKRNSGLFAFLKWFKPSTSRESIDTDLQISHSSSCDSLNSTHSVGTVASFSFIAPGDYKNCVSEKCIALGPETDTYKARLKQRDKIREKDKNLTLRKKYNLFFNRDSLLKPKNKPVEVENSKSLPLMTRGVMEPQEEPKVHRRTNSESSKVRKAGAYVHVKGKRKAPQPPTLNSQDDPTNSLRRRKRLAPPPPNNEDKPMTTIQEIKIDKVFEDTGIIFNDSLKLDHGILKPAKETDIPTTNQNSTTSPSSTRSSVIDAPVSPRAWYKRNLTDKTKKDKVENKYEPIEVPVSRNSSLDLTLDDVKIEKKKEEKRKSGMTFLTNISELDREAYEIVKNKDQDPSKKPADFNEMPEFMRPKNTNPEEYVSPKRRSARDLIAKFNAITNVKKVSVFGGSHKDKLLEKQISLDETRRRQESILENHKKRLEDIDNKKNALPLMKSESASAIKPKKDTPKMERKNWLCPKCNIDNDYWRIICHVCSTIKPYFDDFSSSPKLESNNQEKKITKETTPPKKTDINFERSKTQIGFSALLNYNYNNKLKQGNSSSSDEKVDQNSKREEKEKLKKMLIEMKNSLPKRQSNIAQRKNNTSSIILENPDDLAVPKNEVTKIEAKVHNNQEAEKQEKTQEEKVAEILIGTTTTVYENIKVKKTDNPKPLKVSTSAQTTAAVKQQLPASTIANLVADQRSKNNFELMQAKDFENIYSQSSQSAAKMYANLVRNDELSLFFNIPKDVPKKDEKTSRNLSRTDSLQINRLLKKLELSISKGELTESSNIARELALLKVNCSVVRHKTLASREKNKKIQIEMYVEDKISHRGPFPVDIIPDQTLSQLKIQVEKDFEIPVAYQRWILGKELVTDDNVRLKDHGIITDGCPVFLYLVAPEKTSEPSQKPITDLRDIPSTSKENNKVNITETKITINEGTSNSVLSKESDKLEYKPPKISNPFKDRLEFKNIGANGSHHTPKIVNVIPKITEVILKPQNISVTVSEDNSDKTNVKKELIGTKSKKEQSPTKVESKLKKEQTPPKIEIKQIAHSSAPIEVLKVEIKSTQAPATIIETVKVELQSNDKPSTSSKIVNSESKCVIIPITIENDLKQTNVSPPKTNVLPPDPTLEVKPIVQHVFPTIQNSYQNQIKSEGPKLSIQSSSSLHVPPKAKEEEDFSDYESKTLKPIKEWECHLCTLLNPVNSNICAVCSTIRVRTKIETKEVKSDKPSSNSAQTYYQLLNLDNTDLIENSEPFTCLVCFIEIQPKEGVTLRECLHQFCKPCLSQTIEFSDEAEVKCPYRDEIYACTISLQDREIKALVNATIYEQHLAKSVTQAENKIDNSFHCKTPDCKGWCVYEDNVNEFKCPVCRRTNCLTCQAIHTGMNCRQFQEKIKDDANLDEDGKKTKAMLEEMVQKGEAIECPTCRVILMKKWGCDWLRCSMCKTEICWVTRGPRWGPMGKGDTSGGCQCGVNGIKCHPKCNYCH